MINQKVKDYINEHQDDMIAMRRHLHQHPEVSFEEYETTNFIAEELDALGLEYRRLEPTGIVGEIKGAKPGKTVLLRADMDALSINELNDHLPYKSENEGTMHACGHDSHISMLMAALKALLQVQDEIQGTVRFIFQPAEEIAEGAKAAVEQGVIEGVDNAFGIHIWTVDEPGQVSCQVGPSFAATDIFKVHFQGSGGHAAQPHMTHDALVMGSQYVANIQTLVSRVIDPMDSAVVTVGKFYSGDRFNIIAENAELEGTVRSFDSEARDKIEQGLKDYADHIAKMYGGQATVEYTRLTEAVNNEKNAAQLVQDIASEAFGADKVQENAPTMGGEDFGYYMTEIPGAFATVGAGNPDKETDYPHHHARFNIDEEAMLTGAELYAQYALAYLAQDEF